MSPGKDKLTFAGRVFHSLGSATEKACHPRDVLVHRISRL